MYVARRPSLDQVARGRAHQQALDIAVAERATYERGWRFVGQPGEPSIGAGVTVTAGAELAFFKDSQGFVLLAGQFSAGTRVVVFTLPVGYRPAADIYLMMGAAIYPSGIDDFGNVYAPGGVGSSTATARLDGIRFRTN